MDYTNLIESYLNGNKSFVVKEIKRELKNCTEYDFFTDLNRACGDNNLFALILLNYFYHI